MVVREVRFLPILQTRKFSDDYQKLMSGFTIV